MDGITPQTDLTKVSDYGLTTSNYGFGFTAGASREIVEVDILVSRALASSTVVGRMYQNSVNGASGSGTFVATFTQPSSAVAYVGGITNAYILRLTGTAQLVAGLKYWIYFTAPNYTGVETNYWVTTTPTVSGSWAMVTSGSSYVMTIASNSFTNSAYPAFKLVASTPTTISVSLNAGGSTATFRTSTWVKAQVNSDGPVTFYANKKYIPGCKGIQSSAGVALCNWKPSLHGVYKLTARVLPTDSANYLPKSSDDFQMLVSKRTNIR